MAALFGGIGYFPRTTRPPHRSPPYAITKHPRDWTTRDFERLSDILREHTARDRGRRLQRQEETAHMFHSLHPPPQPSLDPHALSYLAEALSEQSHSAGRTCCCGCGRRQTSHDSLDREFKEEMVRFKAMINEVLFGGVMSPREREDMRKAVYEHVMGGRRGRGGFRGRDSSPWGGISSSPPRRGSGSGGGGIGCGGDGGGNRLTMSLEAQGGMPSGQRTRRVGEYEEMMRNSSLYSTRRHDERSDAGSSRGRDRQRCRLDDLRDSLGFDCSY